MSESKRSLALPPGVREALKELGALIACARKEKGWTQEELARRIGVNRMTVARIEKGAPEAAAGWYLTAAWLLGLPILSWQNPENGRNDTVVGDLLRKLGQTLPRRVRTRPQKIDNDF